MNSIRKKIFEAKVKKSEEVILEAIDRWYPKIGLLWNTGNESTVNLFLTRRIKRDLPVLFVDTTQHFEETYRYRDKIAEKWHLNLVNILPDISPEEVIGDGDPCCHYLKTLPMLMKIMELGLDAVIVGTKWYKLQGKAKEKYFSKRKSHYRVHPLLHWTDEDIWTFIEMNHIPYNSLYCKGYHIIECQPCAKFTRSEDLKRSERVKDKEMLKERLRALGYW